jgi:aryl-alcohol dehydrogenase-like predicted oxidoreductase
MKETSLDRTDPRVSRIAFGTWQLGGDWGATDERAAIAAIRRAADRGITLDTAQVYGFGAFERLLATALRPMDRSKLIITKGGLRAAGDGITRDASPVWIRAGMEYSLRALGTDYIDVHQLHWPDPTPPFGGAADELGKLLADRKIRHVDMSSFTAAPGGESWCSTF